MVSIHAPRVGCDVPSESLEFLGTWFQSTHPVWGATCGSTFSSTTVACFNPRTPCGVRPCKLDDPDDYKIRVSIHAPRVGCDLNSSVLSRNTRKFQSTHPVWGATSGVAVATCMTLCFNPRTPCGVRPADARHCGQREGFQSTHPVWGATRIAPYSESLLVVSIHAPRVGCDYNRQINRPSRRSFNPRTPCGVRPAIQAIATARIMFQSTHPVWGAT